MEKASPPDLYEMLQVSPHAHPLIVAKAFRLLAAVYHPDNKRTGDSEAFRRVAEAYRVLSDPMRRATYDQEHFGSMRPRPAATEIEDDPLRAEEGRDLDERELRPLLLRALYDVRRVRPYKPGISLMVLAELLGCSIEGLQFTLWYLRGKQLIETTEDSDIVITVAGVDYVEASGLAGSGSAQHTVEGAAFLPRPCDPTAGWPLALTGNRNGSKNSP